MTSILYTHNSLRTLYLHFTTTPFTLVNSYTKTHPTIHLLSLTLLPPYSLPTPPVLPPYSLPTPSLLPTYSITHPRLTAIRVSFLHTLYTPFYRTPTPIHPTPPLNSTPSPRQCHSLPDEILTEREVDVIDIAFDDVPEHHYKSEEVYKPGDTCHFLGDACHFLGDTCHSCCEMMRYK